MRSNEVARGGFHAARGEYVALLDGDDFWSSPHKLARQAALLDADRSLSFCFHNAAVTVAQTPFGGLWTDPALKARLTLVDLWEGNPFATCGSLFRRAAVERIPKWYQGFFPITAWPLCVLFADQGDIRFIPETWGVYRLHRVRTRVALDRRARRRPACRADRAGGRRTRVLLHDPRRQRRQRRPRSCAGRCSRVGLVEPAG